MDACFSWSKCLFSISMWLHFHLQKGETRKILGRHFIVNGMVFLVSPHILGICLTEFLLWRPYRPKACQRSVSYSVATPPFSSCRLVRGAASVPGCTIMRILLFFVSSQLPGRWGKVQEATRRNPCTQGQGLECLTQFFIQQMRSTYVLLEDSGDFSCTFIYLRSWIWIHPRWENAALQSQSRGWGIWTVLRTWNR